MKRREQALLLLRKAAQDEALLDQVLNRSKRSRQHHFERRRDGSVNRTLDET
jgi:hypothetical protein